MAKKAGARYEQLHDKFITSKSIDVGLFLISRDLVCENQHLLPDRFRGMGAWGKTMTPQMPGNSPGSGPEIV